MEVKGGIFFSKEDMIGAGAIREVVRRKKLKKTVVLNLYGWEKSSVSKENKLTD